MRRDREGRTHLRRRGDAELDVHDGLPDDLQLHRQCATVGAVVVVGGSAILLLGHRQRA
jgi:hypothetical protein